jgi:hypothetical protein
VNLRALAALPLVLAATGCANADDQVVARVAADFYAAVSSGDGTAACALLAPKTTSELEQSAGTPCAKAVLEEDIPRAGGARSAKVFGTMAQVDLGSDTAFLARFRDGWKVMAVGCTPVPRLPYDCAVSG